MNKHDSKLMLSASRSTEHFNFAEIIWKLVVLSFLGIESVVVSSSCRNVTYRSSSCPVSGKIAHRSSSRSAAGTFTYRPSSSSVSKVTHILSYRRNIVKLLSNIYTFEQVRGLLCKEKKKRRFCVEIEPASLQGLKGEPSNKIGSRNRHHLHFIYFTNISLCLLKCNVVI